MGWKVEFEPSCEKQLIIDFNDGKVTVEDIRVIKKWAKMIEEDGPEKVQEVPTWDDHPLFREWEGCRSSMYSYRGRIIYRILESRIVVSVIKITPVHSYKKEH